MSRDQKSQGGGKSKKAGQKSKCVKCDQACIFLWSKVCFDMRGESRSTKSVYYYFFPPRNLKKEKKQQQQQQQQKNLILKAVFHPKIQGTNFL